MIKIEMTTSVRDATRMLQTLRAAEMDGYVRVSPNGKHVYRSGLNTKQVSKILNKGSKDGKIPARPFLAVTAAKYRRKYARMLALRVKKGTPKVKTLRDIAASGVIDVKRTIRSWKKPKNAPSTERNKGFNDPLVWKKYLHNSITGYVTFRDVSRTMQTAARLFFKDFEAYKYA